MAQRYQGGILGVGFNPLQAPNAPTIGTATAASGTSASVAFTAPANVGGSPITSYAVQSTPDGIGATGSSSPITVSGLTTGTAYTFRVTALNSYGPSPASAASNSVTPAVVGQQAYTTAALYSWVAPAGVTSISVVAVGGGGGGSGTLGSNSGNGGGGGGLAYVNNISVTPGETLSVKVGSGGSGAPPGCGGGTGAESALLRGATYLVQVLGGNPVGGGGASGGTVVVGTGGTGGRGGASTTSSSGGGGGAGGYSGAGGAGGENGVAGDGGSGGGGGGGSSTVTYGGGGGGGVGILGQGASGAGGGSLCGGGGGSGGAQGGRSGACTGDSGAPGGAYGGGGGGANDDGADGANGAAGAVRIIWPGTTRSFPSTNTGNL
jgi:hypothetical protein